MAVVARRAVRDYLLEQGAFEISAIPIADLDTVRAAVRAEMAAGEGNETSPFANQHRRSLHGVWAQAVNDLAHARIEDDVSLQ